MAIPSLNDLSFDNQTKTSTASNMPTGPIGNMSVGAPADLSKFMMSKGQPAPIPKAPPAPTPPAPEPKQAIVSQETAPIETAVVEEKPAEVAQVGVAQPAETPSEKVTPTVAESTSKVNPDGSTTTATKDYTTPEAQLYKKQMDDAMKSIDADVEYAKSKFSSIATTADSAQQNLIKAIEATFEVRRFEMERINTAALNTQQLLGSRSGRQRYAPEMQSSILSQEERSGLIRVTEIDALEYQTIAAAQQAAVTQDLAILNQEMNTLSSLREEKTGIINSLYQSAIVEEQRAQQRAKFTLDIQQKELEISEYQKNNQTSYADSVATGLIGFDSEFNIEPPTAEEVAQMAADIGIDPNILMGSVNNKIIELRKLSSEEYGTYFEREKFAAEMAQKDFQNRIDQQKFSLEEQVFGFKVSEAGFSVVNGELIRVDTGATGSARDWANQIAKGKLKMSDVPADLKSAVVSELESLPPKQEDIQEINSKIGELNNILTSPGITKAVGVNWLSRIQLNPFDWNDKAQKNAFIGKVEQLLSEKTLQSLIDAKNNGATFGALSEGELQILKASSTAIGSWARDTDGDGVTDFYEVDENTFKAEITKIKGDYERLAKTAEEAIPFQPFTNSQDFYKRRTTSQTELYNKFDADPAFDGASVEDLIEAVNEAEGFTGERGAGEVFTSVVSERFPSGTKGGQCGTFAHKIVDFPPVGDLKSEKFASVDKFGIKKSEWEPQVGDVVVTNESQKWGHVAVVNKILPSGELQLTESNFELNEKVSHNRTISFSSPSIYGAIRGTYKA